MDKEGKKLRWTLLPIEPIEEVVKVLNWGAKKKYKDFGWKDIPNLKEQYMNAAWRHIVKYQKGDIKRGQKDKESQLHPLAHAICDLLFVLWKDIIDKEKENMKTLDMNNIRQGLAALIASSPSINDQEDDRDEIYQEQLCRLADLSDETVMTMAQEEGII